MTSSSTICVQDEPRYVVYVRDNLARVDRLPEGVTVARFYGHGHGGWIHRETKQHDPDAVALAYRLMKQGII